MGCIGHISNIKTSKPNKILIRDELEKAGACFVGGYERPMWFALNGEKPEYEYSFNYQNWYPSAEFEDNKYNQECWFV